MLKTYRAGARQLRAELARAADAQDAQAAAAAAHRLKSNANAIGARRLGELCATVEAADATLNAEDLRKQVHSIEAEVAAVDAYLQSLDPRSGNPRP
jgi:HPt (histidine-containing phosphotransfer) domain-containing protein